MSQIFHPHSPFRIFAFSVAATVAAVVGVILGLGWSAVAVTAVLIVIELAFSFDNAIINAKVLAKLSPLWQKLFLSVGIIIAIFGMRVVFPILLVSITASLGFGQVIDMALHDSERYAHYLELAHPTLSSFGGAFLLMLALSFFFDAKKEVHWLRFEKHLQKTAHWTLPPVITALALGGLALLPANEHPAETMKAGLLGAATYAAIQLLLYFVGKVVDKETAGKAKHVTGWAAFISFMYLELLDASFSFDGVIGAFAITQSVVLIAVGLGVGAIWVRSLTVFMVRRKTLEAYAFLEHGAHYAVLVLAIIMLLSLVKSVPEAVTGILTIVIIGLSIWASRRRNASDVATA
ncbi:MAG: hypothetical protein JWM37_768 [Candidatus Saccharibacteria bacterium]|nr:hypothetical protein [Candidatus Saccharibacteria bacterium]